MKYKAHTVGAVVLTAGIIHLNNKIGLEIKPLYLIVGAAFGGLLTITLSFFYKMDKEKLLHSFLELINLELYD